MSQDKSIWTPHKQQIAAALHVQPENHRRKVSATHALQVATRTKPGKLIAKHAPSVTFWVMQSLAEEVILELAMYVLLEGTMTVKQC